MNQKLVIAVNTTQFFLTHRLLLALGAKDKGYEVNVFCPKDNLENYNKIVSYGFKFNDISYSRKGMNPFKELLTLFKFFFVLKALKPDVYHGFTIKPVIYGAICCRLLKIPRIAVTITGLGYVFLKQGVFGSIIKHFMILFYRLALNNKSIRVIFQNSDDKDLFINNKIIKAHQSLIVFGTGIDTDHFCPDENNQFKNKDFVQIIFPARFLYDKGINELIKACEIIYKKHQNFKLFLCGDIDPGNKSSIPQKKLNSWLKLPFVKFEGFQKDMAQIYKSADIVCLPSYREGIPLALIEAASSGLPIVTTDVPGCREVVIENESGFLVPAKEVTLLATQLEKLLLSKGLRAQMGKKARSFALKKFKKDIVIDENLKAYKKAS